MLITYSLKLKCQDFDELQYEVLHTTRQRDGTLTTDNYDEIREFEEIQAVGRIYYCVKNAPIEFIDNFGKSAQALKAQLTERLLTASTVEFLYESEDNQAFLPVAGIKANLYELENAVNKIRLSLYLVDQQLAYWRMAKGIVKEKLNAESADIVTFILDTYLEIDVILENE